MRSVWRICRAGTFWHDWGSAGALLIFNGYFVPHFSVSFKETETHLGTRWNAKFAIQSERIMSMYFVFAILWNSARRLWHGRWEGRGGWPLRSGSFDVNTAGIAWFCRKGRKAQTHYAHGCEQTKTNSFEDTPRSKNTLTYDSRRSCSCPLGHLMAFA